MDQFFPLKKKKEFEPEPLYIELIEPPYYPPKEEKEEEKVVIIELFL